MSKLQLYEKGKGFVYFETTKYVLGSFPVVAGRGVHVPAGTIPECEFM